MTRRKALTIAVAVAGLSGLIFSLLLLSHPGPALSYASYKWQPGCHCGRPATTTTTVKKTTATTAKKTTATTAQKTTTTASKATTTVTSAAKATKATKATATTSSSKTTSAKASAAKKTKKTTTTTAGDDQSGTLAVGAAVSSFPDGGDGGSSGDAGGPLDAGGLVAGDPVAAMAVGSAGPPHYYFSPVAIAFLLIYGVSFALYRTKRLKVATHRKIWNVLLMVTFLLCGILGLVLTVGVMRNPPIKPPAWLLVWHVEAGIAMCLISVFHIGWHLRYYLAIVTGKRRGGRTEKAPAAGRGAPRERSPRPQVAQPALVRTTRVASGSARDEAERRAAFEARQAARGGQAPATKRAHGSSEAERWVEDARRRVVTAS